ncbi:hypothetical protein DFS34DRAFT_608350 [Phlyctochytrium arcticum]|nr:hypothetical protein DFS34DRAFT_608350 [Phlyctochytrium arcticum]
MHSTDTAMSISENNSLPLKLFPPLAPTNVDPPDIAGIVLKHNLRSLSTLLRAPFAVFWSTAIFPKYPKYSISKYLDAFFQQSKVQDTALIRKTFFLFCRLLLAAEEAQNATAALEEEEEQDQMTDAPDSGGPAGSKDPAALKRLEAWSQSEWPSLLHERRLLTIPVLLDALRLFSGFNESLLRHSVRSVLSAQPQFVTELKHVSDIIIDSAHAMQKKLGKATKGKGSKGKARAAEVSDLTETTGGGGSGASMANNIEERSASVDVELLADALLSLRSVALLGIESVTDSLLHRRDLVSSLTDIYQVANTLAASQQQSQRKENGGKSHAEDVIDILLQSDDQIHTVKFFKASIIAFTEALITHAFLEALNCAPDEADTVSGSSMFISQTVERLCDFLMELLELSQFDGPVPFLDGAPLLVDLEIDFSLGNKLKHLRDTHFNASEDGDARLDYLITSLEHMVTFSGNTEIKRQILARQRWRTENEQGGGETSNALLTTNSAATLNPDMLPNEDDVVRTSLISQVQDLFPELGDGFIEACLIAMNNDVETTIMSILEDNLPDLVQKLDRQMRRTVPEPPTLPASISRTPTPPPPLVEQNDILSSRRNVYDGDEFDVFSGRKLDPNSVIFGKKETPLDTLDDKDFVRSQKEELLATQYEDMDDEYDDTYDTSEIKLAGTIELHLVDEEENIVYVKQQHGPPADPAAEYTSDLISLYQSNPSVFQRSQRRHPERAKLRQRTGLSDEQIEGWFSMFERDPKKKQILAKYEWKGNKPITDSPPLQPQQQRPMNAPPTGRAQRHGGERSGNKSGKQQGNGSTRSPAPPRRDGPVASSNQNAPRSPAQPRRDGPVASSNQSAPRSPAQPRRDGPVAADSTTQNAPRSPAPRRDMPVSSTQNEGDTSSPPSNSSTQQDRQRAAAKKERNKSKMANHSRKDGHARKMGRGMGGPTM